MRDLYNRYGIDTSSAAPFRGTKNLLAAEQRLKLILKQSELSRSAIASVAQSDEMKAFNARVQVQKAQQDAATPHRVRQNVRKTPLSRTSPWMM
jgi:hypothetical protein